MPTTGLSSRAGRALQCLEHNYTTTLKNNLGLVLETPHHTRGERLKIATCNVRTLLKDEHMQELEDELKENNL